MESIITPKRETILKNMASGAVSTTPPDPTAQAIESLAKAIKALEKKVNDLTPDKPATEKENKVVRNKVQQEEYEETKEAPQIYRDIVNEVLSPKFDARIKYVSGASFEFTVFVPREYSNATEAEWDQHKADRRSKVIQNFEDKQGVRDQMELILKQLGSEIRGKITDDKSKQGQ